MKGWHVIQTLTGHEERVKEHIEKRLEALGMQDMVSEIVIPKERVIEFRRGKRVEVERKFLPGYILIEAQMSRDLWRTIRQTPGVFAILSDPDNPRGLSERECEAIFAHMRGTSVSRPKEVFELNETVRVIDGPFKDFIGTVGEIDLKHGKVKVMTTILGRVTPVELEIYQIQRI